MGQKLSWSLLLANSDNEGLWENLYYMVSRHSSIRSFIAARDASYESLRDLFGDITQDLFLKLFEKNRWQYYLAAGYSDQTIDHEINHVEIPNLVSQQLRKLRPESYRIARRISTILESASEFKCFRGLAADARVTGRLAHRVYGLESWPARMTMKEECALPELARTVNFRVRDTRRSGRASSSQVIISNKALRELLIDIFDATQSLMEVRTIRLLAMSKLPLEDSKFVSIDDELGKRGACRPEDYRMDLADSKPTPEEALLNREAASEARHLADKLVVDLQHAVRHKPRRFNKLLRIVWHCYFDPTSPSQTEIARKMEISGSLVCHYKKLFESHVQRISLSADLWLALNRALEVKFSSTLNEISSGLLPYSTAPAALGWAASTP